MTEPYIPTDFPCRHCGTTTWRKEIGASDRRWDGGFTCEACAAKNRKPWIGLVSPQCHTEYDARFVLGDAAAERLEPGKRYTNQELAELAGGATFLRESPSAVEKGIKKWRCETDHVAGRHAA